MSVILKLNIKEVKFFWLFFLSLVISYIYVFIIPWRESLGQEFVDLFSYTENIKSLLKIDNLIIQDNNILEILLSQELLWNAILFQLGSHINDIEIILSTISTVSLFLYSLFFLKRVPLVLYLVIILNPLFVDLVMSQIRIALAFSILLVSLDVKNKLLKCLFITSTILIHSAMVVVIFLFYSIYIIAKNKFNYVIIAIYALMVVLFFKYGVDIILELFGIDDRRKNYSEIISGPSITFTLFWLLLGSYFMIRIKVESIEFEQFYYFSYMLFIIFFFFYSSIIDFYAQRFIAISLPFLALNLLLIKDLNEKIMITSIIMLYQLLQYYYWINL